MSDHLQPETQAEAKAASASPWRTLIVLAVLAVIAIPYYLQHREKIARNHLLDEIRQDDQRAQELDQISAEQQARKLAEQRTAEQKVVAKTLAISALDEVESCQSLLGELTEAWRAWEELQQRMHQSEVNYAFADNEALLLRAEQILLRPEKLDARPASGLEKKLTGLAGPLQKAADDPQPGYRVSTELDLQIMLLESKQKNP